MQSHRKTIKNTSKIYQHEPILALTQPLSGGILNIIRISGKDTINLVRGFIRNKKWEKNRIRSHCIYNAHFIDPSNNEIIDEILVLVFFSPSSYTREDMIEIHMHQNRFSIVKILELLYKAGIRQAQPGEFSKRAVLNGRIDIVQAESLDDYIKAGNLLCSKNSLKLMNGELRDFLDELKTKLIDLLALTEANIDFSEDDIDLINYRDLVTNLQKNSEQIEMILKNSRSIEKSKDSLKISIIGKSNAGKSSLFNLLCRKDRAIVSHIPGTTRDFISEIVSIGNFMVEIIDTAGIRKKASFLEKKGIKSTYTNLCNSDVIFLMLDTSKPFEDADRDILHLIREVPADIIYIFNKTDKMQKLDPEDSEKILIPGHSFFISAKTGSGVDNILRYLEHYVTSLVPYQNSVFLTNRRQIENLESINFELCEIINLVSSGIPYDDLIAFHLKEAITRIYSLFGNDLENEVLDRIFSKFCIGK